MNELIRSSLLILLGICIGAYKSVPQEIINFISYLGSLIGIYIILIDKLNKKK